MHQFRTSAGAEFAGSGFHQFKSLVERLESSSGFDGATPSRQAGELPYISWNDWSAKTVASL